MIIGICGGIGSGKSVVSRVLRLKGHAVYDCDSEAKRLMAESDTIKSRIRDEISSDVTDGRSIPDRWLLAEIVFNDEEARRKLNAIVHSAVRKDFLTRMEDIESGHIWIEAAILAESGLAEICDRIWKVEAPLESRISCVTSRDGITRQQAEARIAAQNREERMLKSYGHKTILIYNDENHSILSQVDEHINNINTIE